MTLDRTRQPSIRPMELFQIQKPESYVMPNGIPVRMFRAGEEEVIRLDIMIRGGQWEQTQPLQATFTSRMLREGTAHYTSSEIAEKLDYYGAWLDVSSSMNHSFVTLYSLNKYFPRTLEIVASMLKEPLFPGKELAVVVEENKQQYLVNREKVEVLARKKLSAILFGRNHPCGRFAELEDYDRLTQDVLCTMYRNYYGSRNCTCYLSGCVTPEICKALEQALGQEAWGCGRAADDVADKLPDTMPMRQSFIERPDAFQSALRMGCLSVGCTHPDFLKVRLLMTLFGGYFGSRLMKNIREDKGYTYGIGAGLSLYPFRSVMTISTQAANEYVEPIVNEIGWEIDRLHAELVSEKELTMVKNYVMGDMCRNYESPFSLADAYIFWIQPVCMMISSYNPNRWSWMSMLKIFESWHAGICIKIVS